MTVLVIDAMPLRKEWSYLVGYFLGDGSSSMAGRGREYRQYRVCCHEDDKLRVDTALVALGVEPNWRYDPVSTSNCQATIPYQQAEGLRLNEIAMGNRSVRIPIWPELDKVSLLEGLFDAEGHVGNHKRLRPSGHEYFQRTISLQVVNEGLRDDVYGLLVGQGFKALTRSRYKRLMPHRDIFRLNVNSPDHCLFRERFRLQAKKQAILESLK